MDSGAFSAIMITYALALSTAVELGGLNPVRVVLVTLLVAANVASLVRVHLRLVSRPRKSDYALFLINVAPYLYVLYVAPQPWLALSVIPLAVFLWEAFHGRGRGAVANVAGTALLASAYLPWLAMMGGKPSLAVINAASIWLAYHVFSAIYVEGKLPFRTIKPWAASIWWLSVLPPLAYASLGTGLYLALVEPTIRAIYSLREGKVDRRGLRDRVRRIGIALLLESIIMAVLLSALLMIGGFKSFP
ncbi:hypothetical protein GCM10007981_03980 [Thermocladium modestius]|uniref:Uncharacterized protein n=1 Tax=Thermocladium modestius TaxID=62609 RepID=A0A830GU79_9CREN|nr:hypothetical protein GCM10007981_03980 [Thermocladium modestius]